MTEAELRSLVEAGETFVVEFKGEERRQLSDAELVEAVVCLSNGAGGSILLGVEDDGRVTGARPRHETGVTDPGRLRVLIANKTQPPVSAEVELVGLDGQSVTVVTVPKARAVVGTTDGKYVRRALGGDGRPACPPFHAHEMLAYEIDRGAADYAALEVHGASWDDLDPLEFERLRRLVRESGGRGDQALVDLSDLDIARALALVRVHEDRRLITAGALLLFGREEAIRRHVPTHEVAFQVLSGTSVEVNDITRSSLFRAAEDITGRFVARNSEEEVEFGLLRIAVPLYQETAFREALANALVHRDYTRLGAVHVQWLDGRLEVSNPGGFPPGVSIENLLVTPPRPRSPILADAFKRAGLVERTGRGVNRIFEGQLRYGRQAPDYSRSSADSVIVVLYGGPANLTLVRFLTEESRAGRGLGLNELLVLDELLRERSVTTRRAGQLTQLPEADARQLLTAMVEGGVLESRGEARGRSYHLSAAVYRTLGEEAAYVRSRGFEPFQQEQMILQFVEAHGRITRSQAAELCKVAPERARRILRGLVERGELRVVGERRSAHYIPGPKH